MVSAVQERMGLANYDLVPPGSSAWGSTLHGPFFKYAFQSYLALCFREDLTSRDRRERKRRRNPRSRTADRRPYPIPHRTHPACHARRQQNFGVIERVAGPAPCSTGRAPRKSRSGTFFVPHDAFLFNVDGRAGGEGRRRRRPEVRGHLKCASPGACFWPAANMVNFMYCPPKHRVLFLNGGGLFWNAFLSYQNAKSNAKRLRLPLEGMKKHLA